MTPQPHLPASFGTDPSVTHTGPSGERAHQAMFEQLERMAERTYEVSSGVWSVVGNGLSNQTFVTGPDGIIAIDTGESVEEMAAAVASIRQRTDSPIAAVIYSHFHYCFGTKAVTGAEEPGSGLPVWGHEGIVGNIARMATEIAPAARRGLVHQFGMMLPPDGPDALVGVGLGRFFKNPAHSPGTNGFVAPNQVITQKTTTNIAGLEVRMSPAPSDADDNINIFFPSLSLCVNNIVWPALFNVFPIRGEEYRDPQVLLAGLDEILDAEPTHLIGAHGPPISGVEQVRQTVTLARDAIQFLWDQSVRGINQGLTASELSSRVELPEVYDTSYFTQQHYGLAEHHARQIHSGLRGWFDGDESALFPLPTAQRARRLIEGFGGIEAVRTQADAALADSDFRWAIELSSWLVRSAAGPNEPSHLPSGSDPKDRARLAAALRGVGQRTTSANIRNWCLTRSLELEGTISLDRFRQPTMARGSVLGGDPTRTIHSLRVALDPGRATGVNEHLRWSIDGAASAGLWVRNSVAVPTSGAAADLEISMSLDTLADLLSGRLDINDAAADGRVTTDGDRARIAAVLNCFDLRSLHLT